MTGLAGRHFQTGVAMSHQFPPARLNIGVRRSSRGPGICRLDLGEESRHFRQVVVGEMADHDRHRRVGTTAFTEIHKLIEEISGRFTPNPRHVTGFHLDVLPGVARQTRAHPLVHRVGHRSRKAVRREHREHGGTQQGYPT